ncbi:MAG: glycoside hydrolase family 3 C-terminal domain-containing protein [Bacteroidales bacterium]|nr:glycoside hydrolase family 3 C-terminal domain-containing protein [Bacteroidales bacterium]
MKLFSYGAISGLALLALSCGDMNTPAYQNTKYSFEKRADDLVSKMTLEEKVSQLTNAASAIERLNVPEYDWWNECLHGVARAGKATVFPQAIGMAATFDRDMIFRMADITSTEARAKYHNYVANNKRGKYQGLTFWSPNINIFRDPRWGRGQETYGEDPYLTGELAVQFIRGLQGDDPRYFKVVATSKHYVVHSGPEPLRHQFDAVVSDRDFRDTYLPAFRKTVQEANVYSVMCAYNRTLGEPCCGSSGLQEELLRGELGFEGYIVSDCGAIRDFYRGHNVVATPEEASALGIQSGTDLNCGNVYPSLVKAVEQGLITEEEIDVSVKRLMLARMKLGMFDPDEMVPWSDYPADTIAHTAHNRLALEMAQKSIVLLKNENRALPLSKNLKKVAVIGPNAHNRHVLYGNYNGTPVNPVTAYEGIKARLGETAEVRYAQGSPHHENLPYLTPVPSSALFADPELIITGVKGEYFNNLTGEGKPVFERIDPTVNFHWFDDTPPDGLKNDSFLIRWSGFLVPEKSGDYYIGVEGKYIEFEFNGQKLITFDNVHHPNQMFRPLSLVAGNSYPITISLKDKHVDATCVLHWQEPGQNLAWEALKTALWADHVILVMGLSAGLEAEEMGGFQLDGFEKGDRTSLDLPAIQQKLIKQIYFTGKPVTLVLMTGSAVSINWENEHIKGIVEAWYAGETAGTAIASVLFGDYNPAGRLPVTFYKSAEDLPPFEDYDMAGKTYRYFDGEVLYPFGHGLSYSSFSCENLILDKNEVATGETVTVSVDVTNNGPMDGEEVVQLYIGYPESSITKAIKDLRGFERVMVKTGQTRTVTMELSPDDLELYDEETSEYIVVKGTYQIMVGPSSDAQKLMATTLTVK